MEEQHYATADRMVQRILEKDESEMRHKFYDCVGINSTTGEVERFNILDSDEGTSDVDDGARTQ